MTKMVLTSVLQKLLDEHQAFRIVLSQPRQKSADSKKILSTKQGERWFWQEESFRKQQVFHRNFMEPNDVVLWWLEQKAFYKQALLQTSILDYHIILYSDGKEKIITQTAKREVLAEPHNRKKNYWMQEGQAVEFLVMLGIMNTQGKVHHQKYDKFKQINRYLEIVSDCIPDLPEGSLRIVDFGCGKSYLTFALYWLLHKMGRQFQIIGLDLKEEVVTDCNRIAKELHFENLQFQTGDIASWQNDQSIDLVVSLHACDTATDAALTQAIRWNAKVILAVPCCQHELFSEISDEKQTALLRHGILRERLSSLVTDALRAELLEVCGYQTQIMEFIDLEHTPKNLLIRAVKQQKKTNLAEANRNLESLLHRYGLQKWSMFTLLEKDIKSTMSPL